jgi:hypothetical protein
MLGVLGVILLFVLPLGAVAAGVFTLYHLIMLATHDARARRAGGVVPGSVGDGPRFDGTHLPPDVAGHRRRAVRGGAVLLGCVLGGLALLAA